MIFMTLILLAEGWMVSHRLLRQDYGVLLELLLALPLAALINLVAFILLTLAQIELSALSIIISNLCCTGMFLISVQPLIKTKSTESISKDSLVKIPIILTVISVLILASSTCYAVSHALLPTFHYDSTTNWNMRSKVSFYEGEVVFDTQNGLVSKPNYPFLYHALQISVNQFSPNWSDLSANIIHLLLMLSSLGVVFFFLSRRGRSYALCTMALIVGIPLLTLHTGQSYADITLVTFALLSLSFLLEYRRVDDPRFLMLSGLFICASVWTKSDGIFFCYIPWIIMMSIILVRKAGSISSMRYPVAFAIFLSLSWPVFARFHTLSLTPHGSGDTQFTINTEAVSAFSKAMFVTGSFGMYWYAVIVILVVMIIGMRKNTVHIDRRFLITMLWGLIALAGYMGVYLLTANTEYLIIGQSFDRQILLPVSLLTLSLAYTLIPRRL